MRIKARTPPIRCVARGARCPRRSLKPSSPGNAQSGDLTGHGVSADAPESYPQYVSAQQEALDALSARVADDAAILTSSSLAR